MSYDWSSDNKLVLTCLSLRYLPDPVHGKPPILDSTLLQERWDTVAGVLRLSTKYEISVLREKVATILSRYYPTTLADFDRLDKVASIRFCIAAVNLGRETNLLHILPAAFYFVALLGVEKIAKGMNEDRLSDAEFRVCIIGRDKLCEATRTITYEPLCNREHGSLNPSCTSDHQRCAQKATNTALLTIYSTEPFFANPEALMTLDDWQDINWGDICTECMEYFQELNADGRPAVWRELPQYFGLGSWEALTKDAEA